LYQPRRIGYLTERVRMKEGRPPLYGTQLRPKRGGLVPFPIGRRSWDLFLEALETDLGDIQVGTTPEGIHLGAMAGTVDLCPASLRGLEARVGVLWLDPVLPEELSELELELRYRGHRLQVIVTRDRLVVHSRPGISPPIRLGLRGEVVEMGQGDTKEVTLT
jgi:trehalose/maltose hydrolase-like predicted phosphorylase